MSNMLDYFVVFFIIFVLTKYKLKLSIMNSKKAFNYVRNWDFNSAPCSETKTICITPIPISYEGNLTFSEIESKIQKRRRVEISPIFSGDNKVIYCFSRELAKYFLTNEHKLVIEAKKTFKINTD